jgi:ankyrin repeat protein
LKLAVWNDWAEMAALLLEFGADPNQQDRAFRSEGRNYGGDAALHLAVYKGSAKMVKLLLANGADPDVSNAEGLSPIQLSELRSAFHLAKLMEAHIDKQLSLKATESGIEQLYTIPKIANLLSVEEEFVQNLIKTRALTSIKLDEKTIRVPAGSVERYLLKMRLSQ